MEDPTLDYNSVLSVSSESARVSFNVVSASNNTLTSNDASTIVFNIPSTAYLNPDSSYLTYECDISATNTTQIPATTVVGGATDAKSGGAWVVIDGGATSMFSRASLFTSSSAQLGEIQNFDYVCNSLIKRKGLVYMDTVARQAMGFSSKMEYNDADRYTAESTINPYVSAIRNLEINALQVVAPAATGAQTTAVPINTTVVSNRFRYAIPLSFIASVFNTKNKIPLQHMGVSDSLRLELQINNSQRSLFFAQNRADADLYDYTKLNTYFTIYNPTLVCNVSNVPTASNELVKQTINSTGLHVLFNNVSSQNDSGWLSGSDYTVRINKSLISLDGIAVSLRNGSSEAQTIAWPTVSHYKSYDLQQFSATLGPATFPQTPLRFLTGGKYNGQAFLENYLAKDGLKGLSGSSESYYSGNYNSSTKSGFEIGLNFSNEMPLKNVMSGKDLRAGANSMSINLVRDTTVAVPLHVHVIMFSSNAYVISRGNQVIPPALG